MEAVTGMPQDPADREPGRVQLRCSECSGEGVVGRPNGRGWEVDCQCCEGRGWVWALQDEEVGRG